MNDDTRLNALQKEIKRTGAEEASGVPMRQDRRDENGAQALGRDLCPSSVAPDCLVSRSERRERP